MPLFQGAQNAVGGLLGRINQAAQTPAFGLGIGFLQGNPQAGFQNAFAAAQAQQEQARYQQQLQAAQQQQAVENQFRERSLGLQEQGLTPAEVREALFVAGGDQVKAQEFLQSNSQARLRAQDRAFQAQQAELNRKNALEIALQRKSYASGLTPEQNDALASAIEEGRLDPSRVNSRTARFFADLELKTPGTNYNRLTADAALQKNATFQQRAMTMEALPEVMDTMVDLGKKIGFSDNRTIGKVQAWAKGEFNDPDYQAYMTLRNDALMSIAGVMRGVGMSDQAHRAEIEAAAPTMSPKALDAWLNAQTHALEPRLRRYQRVQNLGGVTNAPEETPEGVISLEDFLGGN